MPWLDELYQRLLQGAATTDGPPARESITFSIIYPPRIGTLVMRLPGGTEQTAEVVVPGHVVTLNVAQVEVVHTSGAVEPRIANAFTSSPLPYPSSSEPAFFSPPSNPSGELASDTSMRSITPANFAPPDVPRSIDQNYASESASLTRAFECVACVAAGTWCWRTDPSQGCDRCTAHNIPCIDS
ncbi:hypothetical protein L227DRAFT_229980 [Lentinus tigrinus ALCF2SS1-6]|uniref:Uncharacterized protein n=1 Tax=Lentinus tigrinus ALCF2SS1-6 TaxID=1328759 RepID=A0A5C2S1K1_9APHY|nr:hypothetical protein L227DRAFT_229980 [Lentinus tigrinus ALCF2SS1-6]